MNISSNNSNRINQVDSVRYINNLSGESVVTKVRAVQEVVPGFNPATIYLVKLAKAFRKNNVKLSGKKINELTHDEFQELVFSLQDDFDDCFDIKNLKEQQMFLMQDILSEIIDESETEKFDGSNSIEENNSFYYNKALVEYEKSYDNIAEFNSNGLMV